MTLVAPFRVSLNPASTAVILTDSNNVTKILQRAAFIPYQIGTDTVGLTFIVNSRSESITAPFGNWRDAANAPLAANQYDTLVALSNLMGFNLGSGGGSVTGVTASLPLISSGGATPDISLATQPNGNYGLNFSGGIATFIPIQGETVGSYKAFSTTVIPANYLWCNGASVLVASYPQLFAIIGYSFGGSGANFTLPNLQDRLLKGDNGTNIGNSTGSNSLTIANLPQHSHSLIVNNNIANTDNSSGTFISSAGDSGGGLMSSSLNNSSIANSGSIGLIGGNTPHEHPNIAVRWAICFESVGISGASPTPSFNAVLGVGNTTNLAAEFANGTQTATIDEKGLVLTDNAIDLITPSVTIESGLDSTSGLPTRELQVKFATVESGGGVTQTTILKGNSEVLGGNYIVELPAGSGVLALLSDVSKQNIVPVSTNITAAWGNSYHVTTGNSDLLIALPSSLTNVGKTLAITKVDSGAGRVLINEFAGEPLNGNSQTIIQQQWGSLVIRAGIVNPVIEADANESYVLSESGTTVIPPYNNSTPNVSTFIDLPSASFTAPSNGKYNLTLFVPVFNNGGILQLALTDSSNNILKNVRTEASAAFTFETGDINLTIGQTVKFRIATNNVNVFVPNAGNGFLYWRKVAGHLPVSGFFVPTANEFIVTNTTPYVATDNIQSIYINPIAFIATANITLPPNPTNGQRVVVGVGGAITSGLAVSTLTVLGTVGKNILSGDAGNPNSFVAPANAADTYTFQYSSQLSKWLIL